jgi:4-carboxymuconolactone decarboxylase
MRLSKPRLEPLAEADIDPEIQELLRVGREATGGRILNIFATLARHPKLLKRWLVFGNHVLAKTSLPPRERELVILRTGWLCGCEYEWGQHVAIARASGVSDEEIARVARGPDAPGWTPLEAALLRAADDLHGDAVIGDATWAALAEHLDERQLLDVIFTVGQYTLVSMALNSLGVQREAGVPGFPASTGPSA